MFFRGYLMTTIVLASALVEALAFLGGPDAYTRAITVDEDLASSMCLEHQATLPPLGNWVQLDVVEVSAPTNVTVTPVVGRSRVHQVAGNLAVTVRDARNSLTRTVRVNFFCSVYGRGTNPWRYQIISHSKQYPNPDGLFVGRRPPSVL